MPDEQKLMGGADSPGLRSAPRGVYKLESRPAEAVVPILFVGGTGRSGTHIVSRVLGRHHKIAAVPVECRFHVEECGFPGLLEGTVELSEFLDRLRGFWWRGRQRGRERGMFRVMPRERFEAAVETFARRFEDEREQACRELFLDLLWPQAVEKGASCIVEQSCDVISQAPVLTRLFPEAAFVHVVRDGRDASASRVSQTRGLIYPRTRMQGLEWWERRIRAIDTGRAAIPEDRFLEYRLEWLLSDKKRKAVKPLVDLVGVSMGPKIRRFARHAISDEGANRDRWRRGLSARKAKSVERTYEEILDRLEADEVSCVPLLRGDARPVE